MGGQGGAPVAVGTRTVSAGAPARGSARRAAGGPVPVTSMTTITGAVLDLRQPGPLWHLQFRRFAGCPVCNLHLRGFARRAAELEGVVREVILFHARTDELAPHVEDLPFPVVADPDKRLYRAFGVETAARALLHPAAWPGIVQAVASAVPRVLAGRDRLPSASPQGGRLGLPADFLVSPDGRLRAVHYGRHANDQWSVDALLALAAPPVQSR